MPQLCTICTHPQSHEIDLEIVRGKQSNRDIAGQFGVTKSALSRHRTEHLAEKLQQAQAVATKIETIDLNRELATVYTRATRFFEACHTHLLDPDDPDRYYVGPRSEEVTVIYDEKVGDKTKRSKARLNTLLKRVEEGLGYTVVGYDVRQADVRSLFLQSSQQLLDEIHRIGEQLGLFFAKKLDPEVVESMRAAVAAVQHEYAAKYNLQLTWEQTVDKCILYYPSKRAYLEQIKEEGPQPPDQQGLLP